VVPHLAQVRAARDSSKMAEEKEEQRAIDKFREFKGGAIGSNEDLIAWDVSNLHGHGKTRI
jgi:hypothetical protein